jgi:predicted nucleotide-binding protein
MLRNLHDRIELLIAANVTASEPEFTIWKNQVERLIIRHYGEDSIECKQFQAIDFFPGFPMMPELHKQYVDSCKWGLEIVRGMLENFMEEWEVNTMSLIDSKPTKVFIVHGHDELLKVKIARLVEQQGIEAIILSEKENEGKTIIEKLEGHSDVGAAILLFTPDDSGKEIFEENAKPRARQNVVFEAGFFMGKLGRNKTIMVATGKNLELPSDLHGLIYTSDTNWQFSIIREMKAMGFDVDMNKVKF